MSKHKLLLADDSITIQKVVNLTFADEGIEVFTFGDGDAAFENIAAVEPDILLADVNMPGMSGYQICESVRNNEATKDVPVILLVGSFEPFDHGEAKRVRATGHMTKPFTSIAKLVATVKGMLDNSAAEDRETQKAEPVLTSETEHELGPASELGPEQSQAPERSSSDEDIESLYRQSFAETVELPRNNEPVVEFGDDGIDDEMIQTSYAESDAETVSDAAFFEAVDVDDLKLEQEGAAATNDQSDTASREYVVSEPPVEAAEPAAAVDYGAAAEASNDSFEEAAAPTFDTSRSGSKSSDFQFDEVDLLELPAFPNGTSYKFDTAERAGEAGGREQIVSLSPELMDIIVQKVVEKLAEKY